MVGQRKHARWLLWWVAATALALGLGFSGAASAFHPPAHFAAHANSGHGSRMYYTGSPRWKGYDCGTCHVDAPGDLLFSLSSEPEDIFAAGEYEPGKSYTIVVKRFNDPKAVSNFMLEVNDDNDAVVGSYDNVSLAGKGETAGGLASICGQQLGPTLSDGLCTQVATCEKVDANEPLTCSNLAACQTCSSRPNGTCDAQNPDCLPGDGVVGGQAVKNPWYFAYKAPEPGAGAITFYLGGVGQVGAHDNSAYADDVFMGTWRLCEKGTSCQSTGSGPAGDPGGSYNPPAASSCSLVFAAPARRRNMAWLAFLFMAAFAVRRRRGGRLGIRGFLVASGVLLIAAQPGCQTVDTTSSLPPLDEPFFRCQVEPVLMARCGFYPCHGSEQRPFVVYAPNRFRLEAESPDLATPLTVEEMARNFDMSRAFAQDERLDGAWLLSKPLDVEAGGFYHVGKRLYQGRDVFTTVDDVGYQQIAAWIGGATAEPNCAPTMEVGP